MLKIYGYSILQLIAVGSSRLLSFFCKKVYHVANKSLFQLSYVITYYSCAIFFSLTALMQ